MATTTRGVGLEENGLLSSALMRGGHGFKFSLERYDKGMTCIAVSSMPLLVDAPMGKVLLW